MGCIGAGQGEEIQGTTQPRKRLSGSVESGNHSGALPTSSRRLSGGGGTTASGGVWIRRICVSPDVCRSKSGQSDGNRFSDQAPRVWPSYASRADTYWKAKNHHGRHTRNYKFGNVLICAVYVPPSGNAARAATRIADCVYQQLQRTPGAPIVVLGDFNHCKLELSLPGFDQYVTCDTRQNRVLDKCYGNIKNAYTAKPLPPLSNSDHNTVQLIPIYKTVFKRGKPQTKTVTVWDKDSIETLKGSFLCTDWDIFSDLEIDDATEAITDYIHFCADNVVAKKDIVVYPNNKPYITKSVKDCINRKKLAFKNNDRAGLKMVQRELNQRLREARKHHKDIIEQTFMSMDSKKLWDSMKAITNMNTTKKRLTTDDDLGKAN